MTQRILFVVNQGAFFVTHRLELAVSVRDAGYEVHIALPTGDAEQGWLRSLGFTVHGVPIDRTNMNPFGELAVIASLVMLYRRVRPHLVHHVTVKPVLFGSIAARIAGVPAVVNAVSGLGFLFIGDGRFSGAKRRAAFAAYRFALHHPHITVIFQNADDRFAFINARVISEAQTVLIPGSGVNLLDFAQAPEPNGVPVVMLTGRMLWHKGIGEFVAAARLLRAANVNARLVLVGGTDVNPSSVSEVQLHEWHADGVIEWWGQRDDMPAVLAGSTLVCLPSYREGIPKALLEAAAVGRAIVTTDTPGCRDVVRDGDNGLLVPVRSVKELANAIRLLLENPSERGRMARRSRERAVAEFDVSFVIKATLDVYAAALRSSSMVSMSSHPPSKSRSS